MRARAIRLAQRLAYTGRQVQRQHGRWWLSLAGLVWLVVAAWGLSWVAGAAVAGVACWLLEWRLSGE